MSTTPAATQAQVDADLKAAAKAELAVLEARVAVLEADAKTDWAALKSWVKSNWIHVLIAVGVGALVVKIFDLRINL